MSASTLKRKRNDGSSSTEVRGNEEPSIKRRKVISAETESTWSCTECTYDNCAIDAKCVVCLAARTNPNQANDESSIFSQTAQEGDWDDDEDKQEPHIRYSHVGNTELSPDGVFYYDCWIFAHCYATNLSPNMYTASTPFDCDKKDTCISSKPDDPLILRRELISRAAHREEDVCLVAGMLRESHTSGLYGFPDAVVRLIVLYFDSQAFDSSTNRKRFELDLGLMTCQRTEYDLDMWCNVFGSREAFSVGREVRFVWGLKVTHNSNRQCAAEMDTVIIGVMEAQGVGGNMGGAFTQYKDGWGVVGIGEKVTDGMYEPCQASFGENETVLVSLVWVGSISKADTDRQQCCYLRVGNTIVFELPPDKKYRPAVAAKSAQCKVEWVSFDATWETPSGNVIFDV